MGDVDILSDRLWVQQQNFLGQTLATAFANNGDFLINALDNLSGSADLIGIRARGTYSRPFTRVQALRRQADAQFRQTEQRLQAELTETENRLGELQDARTDQGSLLMSDEQQAEIQRFLDEQVRIRQELRAVQRKPRPQHRAAGHRPAIHQHRTGAAAADRGRADGGGCQAAARGEEIVTTRTVTVLAAALVVLGAVALLAQYDPQPPAPGGGLLLPDLGGDLDRITEVSIVGAGSQPVATLARGEDGSWSVAEKDGYPADVEKVRQTLIGLAEARIVEPKTANPDFYDRLGVEGVEDEAAGGVAVVLTGADTPVNVIVGNTEGTSQVYVRETDQAQSFLVDRNPDVGSETTDWLATEILAIPGSRMARVTVTHPDGETVTVAKADSEQSNFDLEAMPPGRELQYASVANVMGNVLSNLNLQDVEPRTATDEPMTVTEFVTFDGLTITAESLERGDEPWVAFRAEYRPPVEEPEAEDDPAQEADAANVGDEVEVEAEGELEADADGADVAAGEAETEDADGTDVAAEALALDQRLSPWRYRIASHQFDQMTRRLDDLLRDLPEETADE